MAIGFQKFDQNLNLGGLRVGHRREEVEVEVEVDGEKGFLVSIGTL